MSWYLIGFTLASGPKDHDGFLGWTQEDGVYIAMADIVKGNDYINWFFGWAFAATASTIVSGALAERTQFRAYFLFATLLTAWVYPIVAYWVWSPNGWLKIAGDDVADEGFLDFAGSGVVHMVGGACALVGAYFVGPRKYMDSGMPGVYISRFSQDAEGNTLVNEPFHNKSNPALSTVGTMILWFGWFGFNGGSQFGISGDNLSVVGLCVVNTTLCPAAAVVTLTLLALALGEHTEIGDLLNAALGGLVSITANCNVVEPWAAVLIGIIGAFVYRYSSKLLIKLQIDDVINASPVHFFCGVWGLIATGLFAKPELGGMATHTDGLFYGGGKLLGWQVLGTLMITAWSVLWSGLFFGLLSKCDFLRVGSQVEKIGLDNYNKIADDCADFGAGPASPKSPAGDVENPIAPGTPVVAAKPIIQLEEPPKAKLDAEEK